MLACSGAILAANVRVREHLSRAQPDGDRYRWRTRHRLAPGRYYVEVSGVVALDCTRVKPCPTRWSNVRRVVIPAPSRGRRQGRRAAPSSPGLPSDQAGQGFELRTLRKLLVRSRSAGFGFG